MVVLWAGCSCLAYSLPGFNPWYPIPGIYQAQAGIIPEFGARSYLIIAVCDPKLSKQNKQNKMHSLVEPRLMGGGNK